jgi:tyrosyl-tRNA synthetase
LKELRRSYFLEVFDGVPQAEISRSEVEAGVDIVILLNEKTGFLNQTEKDVRLQRTPISVNKKK